MYRLGFLGLSEEEATERALRELGSPEAVALELGRTHSLPHVARAALMFGVTGLLGFQALAQVPTVRAIADPTVPICRMDEAFVRQLPPPDAAKLRRQLARPGERVRLEAECRAKSPAVPNNLLRLKDIVAALTAGGVKVGTMPEFAGFLELTFPGEAVPQALDLSYDVRTVNGETYIQTWALVSKLRSSLTVPLRLKGLNNPTLELGPARLQLGTPAQPVRATNLYTVPLHEQLSADLSLASGTKVDLASRADQHPFPSPDALKVQAPDGALFVTVSNEQLLKHGQAADCDCQRYLMSARAVHNGSFPATLRLPGKKTQPRLVGTPAELFRATAKKQWAILVYRLDASDLRQLKLTPVPPTALGQAVTVEP